MTHAFDRSAADPSATALASRLPNLLYLGTAKAGSTWIYQLLAAQPSVYIAPGKGAYYFDHHYDQGLEWYASQFQAATTQTILGDISHSYLFSAEAARRIAATVPQARLMVCLREPVERAYSAYLDAVKNGRFSGTFEEALEANPTHVQRGEYGAALRPYLELFPRSQLHVAVFDDLQTDAQRFADDLLGFLGLPQVTLTSGMRQKMMPAAKPRSRAISQFVKRLAWFADRCGLRRLRGTVKRSRWVRNALYRPYRSDEIPSMTAETRARLREHFRPDVAELDRLAGTTLMARWQYA